MTAAAGRSARLFVALWPGDRVREALAAAGEQWAWSAAAVRAPAARLHLTLHFIGEVGRDRVPALREALSLPCAPFSLALTRPAVWPGGIAVLEPQHLPPGLGTLHSAIGKSLQSFGLPVDPRPLRPHVTLARHAGSARPPTQPAPVRWQVRGFALVESVPAAGYAVLQRFGTA